MDNEQQLTDTQSSSDTGAKKRLFIAVSAALLLVLLITAAWLFLKSPSSEQPASSQDAAAQLYDVLGNASQQQKLQVAMYRATYANIADADAGKNVGTVLSSVSGLDATNAHYRSVWATNIFDKPKFDIGRCMDGATYNDNYTNDNQRPHSLKQADKDLKTRTYQITQPLTFIPCPYLGIYPNSTPDVAVSRLSDGVFPVTLSQQQAADWTSEVKEANLFDVKDEGMAEYQGKQLRKISFAPKAEMTSSNKTLYDIFYQVADIEKIKTEQPNASWRFGFIAINPQNTGGIGGYYLIDEATNLPVYSELYGINPDRKLGESSAAGSNIARTKQTYEYPAELTITAKTPLHFLE